MSVNQNEWQIRKKQNLKPKDPKYIKNHLLQKMFVKN